MSTSIFPLMRKDLKILLRSKLSLILILLIPLLIVLLAGYALDSSNLSNVYVGVHSNYSSNLSQKIVSGFEASGLKIKEYSSVQGCIDAVKLNTVQICTVFYNDPTSGNSVRFYVDYSRINLASNLVNEAQNSVNVEANEEGAVFVQDLINTINLAKEVLPQAKISLESAYEEGIKSKNFAEELDPGTEEISTALSYLEDAKERTNDSSVLAKISSAISILKTLNQSSGSLSVNLGELVASQNLVLSAIDSSSDGLIMVLDDVNSKTVMDAKNIISPIQMQIEPLNKSAKNRDYLIPVLISLIALFTAILLSSTFVLKEKKTLAYFRNFMTPTKTPTFLIATFLTCLLILIIQFGLVFAGIKFILGMNNFGVSFELVAILLLAFVAFISIGMFVGYLFQSEEAVIFASMITAGVFLFFSNTILPIENISFDLMKLSMFNPLVLLDSALKKIILFNLNFVFLKTELFYLGGFGILFALLAYFARKLTSRNL